MGTNGFTSIPKEGMLRIFFSPWKIRRLRPGLNPRVWVPKASATEAASAWALHYLLFDLTRCLLNSWHTRTSRPTTMINDRVPGSFSQLSWKQSFHNYMQSYSGILPYRFVIPSIFLQKVIQFVRPSFRVPGCWAKAKLSLRTARKRMAEWRYNSIHS